MDEQMQTPPHHTAFLAHEDVFPEPGREPDDAVEPVTTLLASLSEDSQSLPSPGWWASAAELVVSAILNADVDLLDSIRSALGKVATVKRSETPESPTKHAEAHGGAEVLAEVCRVAALRSVPRALALHADSHSAHLVLALAEAPGSTGRELAAALGLDPSSVSRIASRLSAQGILLRERAGKAVSWRLSPRGEQAAGSLTGHRVAELETEDIRELAARAARLHSDAEELWGAIAASSMELTEEAPQYGEADPWVPRRRAAGQQPEAAVPFGNRVAELTAAANIGELEPLAAQLQSEAEELRDAIAASAAELTEAHPVM